MTPEEIIERIEAVGGLLALEGEQIYYELPTTAVTLLGDLQRHRIAVVEVLRSRHLVPAMPQGVRLTRWDPKPPPIILTRWSVVLDTHGFIAATLLDLYAALAGKTWLAGNWSVRELIDRLEQVGVTVEVDMGRLRGK